MGFKKEERMSTTLETIEGIGGIYADKLKEQGINTCEELLEKGKTPEGRKAIEDSTEIGHAFILKWVNRSDLARVKGIGGEYADLLECSGVDTVPELAQRNTENLTAKITEINEEKNLVRKLPTQDQIEDWISQAKDLPRVVTY